MSFATFHLDTASDVFPTQQQTSSQPVRDALAHIRTRSVPLGWIRYHDTWTITKETRSYWDTFIALLFIAQHIARTHNVLTARLAPGIKNRYRYVCNCIIDG